MSISTHAKAKIIASLTVGGIIAVILMAVGCQGNYGVIEEERVSFDNPPVAPASFEVPAVRAEPAIIHLPEIEVKPDTVRHVTYKQAEAAFLARNYTEAVELFTHYTRRKKNNAWGFYMLGLSAKRAGDLMQAEESLEAAANLDPRHIKSWVNLARVRVEKSEPQEALTAIDEALLLDPSRVDAYRLKGRVLHQLGDLTDAEAAYKQALILNRSDAWSMNNLALVLLQQRRFDDALPLLARAVEIKDDAAVFYNNLGMALENKGHYRKAEDAYAKAVEIDGSHARAAENAERVARVAEPRGLETIDLALTAASLDAEIDGWGKESNGNTQVVSN